MLAAGLGKHAARTVTAEDASRPAGAAGQAPITNPTTNIPIAENSQTLVQGDAAAAPWGEQAKTAYDLGLQLGKQAETDILGSVGKWWGGLAPQTQTSIIGGGIGALGGGLMGGGAGMIAGGLAGAGAGYAGHDWLQEQDWFKNKAQPLWRPEAKTKTPPVGDAKMPPSVAPITPPNKVFKDPAEAERTRAQAGALSQGVATATGSQQVGGTPTQLSAVKSDQPATLPGFAPDVQKQFASVQSARALAPDQLAAHRSALTSITNTPFPSKMGTPDELIALGAQKREALSADARLAEGRLGQIEDELTSLRASGQAPGEGASSSMAESPELSQGFGTGGMSDDEFLNFKENKPEEFKELMATRPDAKLRDEAIELKQHLSGLSSRTGALNRQFEEAQTANRYLQNLPKAQGLPANYGQMQPAQQVEWQQGNFREAYGQIAPKGNIQAGLTSIPPQQYADGRLPSVPGVPGDLINAVFKGDSVVIANQTPEALTQYSAELETGLQHALSEVKTSGEGITDSRRGLRAMGNARDTLVSLMTLHDPQMKATTDGYNAIVKKMQASGGAMDAGTKKTMDTLKAKYDKLQNKGDEYVGHYQAVQRKMFERAGQPMPPEIDPSSDQNRAAEIERLERIDARPNTTGASDAERSQANDRWDTIKRLKSREYKFKTNSAFDMADEALKVTDPAERAEATAAAQQTMASGLREQFIGKDFAIIPSDEGLTGIVSVSDHGKSMPSKLVSNKLRNFAPDGTVSIVRKQEEAAASGLRTPGDRFDSMGSKTAITEVPVKDIPGKGQLSYKVFTDKDGEAAAVSALDGKTGYGVLDNNINNGEINWHDPTPGESEFMLVNSKMNKEVALLPYSKDVSNAEVMGRNAVEEITKPGEGGERGAIVTIPGTKGTGFWKTKPKRFNRAQIAQAAMGTAFAGGAEDPAAADWQLVEVLPSGERRAPDFKAAPVDRPPSTPSRPFDLWKTISKEFKHTVEAPEMVALSWGGVPGAARAAATPVTAAASKLIHKLLWKTTPAAATAAPALRALASKTPAVAKALMKAKRVAPAVSRKAVPKAVSTLQKLAPETLKRAPAATKAVGKTAPATTKAVREASPGIKKVLQKLAPQRFKVGPGEKVWDLTGKHQPEAFARLKAQAPKAYRAMRQAAAKAKTPGAKAEKVLGKAKLEDLYKGVDVNAVIKSNLAKAKEKAMMEKLKADFIATRGSQSLFR